MLLLLLIAAPVSQGPKSKPLDTQQGILHFLSLQVPALKQQGRPCRQGCSDESGHGAHSNPAGIISVCTVYLRNAVSAAAASSPSLLARPIAMEL